MSLFLILHKARGEFAFDVATTIECPCCTPEEQEDCGYCGGIGYWWQVPTSGHRAYPIWSFPLSKIVQLNGNVLRHLGGTTELLIPDDHPDHYAVNDREVDNSVVDMAKSREFLVSLGLAKQKEPIRRRV